MAGHEKESSTHGDDPLDRETTSAEAAPEGPDDPAANGTEPEQPTAPAGALSPGTAATSAATPVEAFEAAPTVQLVGLGLRGARGWAFRDVDLLAHPGELVVITGASGSGRSILLLAIAGRLRPTTGSLQVAGTSLAAGRPSRRVLRQVRERVAVARIAGHIGLDGDLSVEINARDAADWAGRRPADIQDRLEEWRGRSGLTLPPRTPVAELTALESTALHLLLAAAVSPEVIVLDDADAALTPNEREQLWQIAADVAATGPVVIATATAAPAQADVHVMLPRHAGPAAHAAASLPADQPAESRDEPAVPDSGAAPSSAASSASAATPDSAERSPEPEDIERSPDREDPESSPDAEDPEPVPDGPSPDDLDETGTDRDGAEK